MTGKRKRDDAGIDPWIRNDRHHDYRFNDQTSSRYDYGFDDQNSSRHDYRFDDQNSSRHDYRIDDQNSSRHDYRFDDQTKSRYDYRFDDQTTSRNDYRFNDQSSSRLDYGFDGTSTNGFNSQPNNSRLDYVFNDPSSSRSGYTRTVTDTTVASVSNVPESSDEILKELGKCYLKNLSTGGVEAGGATAGYSSGGDKTNHTSYRSTSAVLGYQGGYRPSYTKPIENSFQGYSNNRTRKRQRHQSNEISAQHQWKPSNGFKKQKTNPQQSAKNVTLKNKEPSDHGKTSTQQPKNKLNTASINENEKQSFPRKGLSAADYKKIAQFKAENLPRPAFRKVKADWHELKQNNFLSEIDRYCVYYMKIALSRTGEEDLAQAILSTVYTRHRNALKLFRFALKTFMDKKYGEEKTDDVLNKKMKFLIAVKGTLLKHLKMILVMRTGKELHVRPDDTCKAAVKVVDNFLPELTGDKFTEEMIPSEDDYFIDPSKTQDDQVRYFQHEFFILAYEVFSCRLRSLALEDVIAAPSLENQLKFHFNNALIPLLLIEIFELEQKKIPVKETTLAIPKSAKKFVYVVNFQSQATSLQLRKRIDNRIAQEHKKNDYLETDIMDFIGQHEAKLSTLLVRNFANLILMFDKLAQSIKYRLLNYTPHINLSSEMKKSTFDEIMKRMYTDTLVLLQNYVHINGRKIEAMEGIVFKKVGRKKDLELKEQKEQDTDGGMKEEEKVERAVVLIDNDEVTDNVSMKEEEKVERTIVLINNDEVADNVSRKEEEKNVERTVVLIDNDEVTNNVSMKEEEKKVERTVILIDNEELEK